MRASALALAIAIVAPSAWAGELAVTVAPGRITVAATAAPVSDVLELLARKTGMKIIYDDAPPRLLVSPRVERETAGQAVLAVLEGLGLAYVLITDSSASRVETLFIASGLGGQGSATTANRPPGSPPPGLDGPQEKVRPQPDDDDEEDVVRAAPMPQEPEPPKAEPPKPQLPPSAVYPGSPFGPQGPPQPVVIPGQPFIPGVTPPSPPPPPQ